MVNDGHRSESLVADLSFGLGVEGEDLKWLCRGLCRYVLAMDKQVFVAVIWNCIDSLIDLCVTKLVEYTKGGSNLRQVEK